jgi:ER lumen protein retaining receptor
MKFVFTGVTVYTCYLFILKKPYTLSYNRDLDNFPHYFLYGAAAAMTMVIHKSFLPLELLWSYSQWLEAFAILPQLMMINQMKNI